MLKKISSHTTSAMIVSGVLLMMVFFIVASVHLIQGRSTAMLDYFSYSLVTLVGMTVIATVNDSIQKSRPAEMVKVSSR